MRKLFCLIFALLLIPVFAFATNSPTTRTKVYCEPEIPFEMAIETLGWETALTKLDEVDTDGYILLEALYITLPIECDPIEWYLLLTIEEKDEPFIIILDAEEISEVEFEITERGNFLTDLSAFEEGNYYLCFFIKAP